ncbi:DNA repair protein RecO [Fontivita pretiosa]|jgi:DNA repair protein RecO (recombination protein O)|uniref:DNA repair protein RecO n=1 Tax=Fontivita pretiosa TaxID=2989684 RepID=UPI003D1857CC
MPLVSDCCICLRKTEYSETSQILMLLGREHGIVRVIAKGAHRKTRAGASRFDGGVDLLDLGQAVLTYAPERELGTLCEWSLREGHLALRRNLRALYLALYAAELTSLLFEEHDPHPELFDRLEQTLRELPSPRIEQVFLAFELDLLREAGYVPQLSECVMCGSSSLERAYFSAARGGVVCRNCEQLAPDRIVIDPRLLRLVQTMSRLPRTNGSPQRLPQLTRYQTDPINKLLAEHVEHTLSRRLRMRSYVLS